MRFALSSCIYGFPTEKISLSSPCQVSCATLSNAIESGLGTNVTTTDLGFCNSANFSVPSLFGCPVVDLQLNHNTTACELFYRRLWLVAPARHPVGASHCAASCLWLPSPRLDMHHLLLLGSSATSRDGCTGEHATSTRNLG